MKMKIISSVKYEVKTVTSNEQFAETDDECYYTITGTRGKTAEYKADNPGDDRELGQTDTYTFTDNTDIGEFRCVSIRSGGSDGWGFTEVSFR